MVDATGRLVLVATPIGNLGDLSARAVASLADADVIACEDTRRTRALLSAAGVPAPHLLAVHEHNEASSVARVVGLLERGKTVVLVSDAGTPAISDPGERLVAGVAAAGHVVEAVPGPSAALTALVVSGLPTGRFAFEGFLPRKGAERVARLAEVAAERRTVVLYEAPHRIVATVADLTAVCGGRRRVVLGRELTKRHEEVWRGTLAEAAAHLASGEVRGEFVVVLDGAPARPPSAPGDVRAALELRLAAGLDRRAAVADVADDLGVPKREVYAEAVALGRPGETG